MAQSLHYSGMTLKTPEKTMKSTAIARRLMANANRAPMVRGYAEHIDGSKFRFVCPAGHSHTSDINKGRKGMKMGDAGISMMASWWAKEKGGCSFPCPGCRDVHGGVTEK